MTDNARPAPLVDVEVLAAGCETRLRLDVGSDALRIKARDPQSGVVIADLIITACLGESGIPIVTVEAKP